MLLNKTIRLFLDSIGRREEYEFYLGKFQSADTACFALLVPDLESLDQAAEAFAFDLHFLLKLGLKPAVVLCGADAEAKWRILKDDPLFEYVQFPTTGNSEGRIPVFAEENVRDLEKMIPGFARRVHFIRAAGGFGVDYFYVSVGASGGRAQTAPKLRGGYSSGELSEADRSLVELATALLTARPGTHVSVTSPINLLQEIFTVKGSGTVFRRGSTIISAGTPDQDKLLALLEESFGKKPKAAALAAVTRIYLEENYRGAVLLEDQPAGLYLSKFAVGPEARGEGLAQELWDEVCKNHPAFFWRSRKGNSVNQWYDRHADGRHIAGDWVIFWRGVKAEQLSDVIAFCHTRESDFI